MNDNKTEIVVIWGAQPSVSETAESGRGMAELRAAGREDRGRRPELLARRREGRRVAARAPRHRHEAAPVLVPLHLREQALRRGVHEVLDEPAVPHRPRHEAAGARPGAVPGLPADDAREHSGLRVLRSEDERCGALRVLRSRRFGRGSRDLLGWRIQWQAVQDRRSDLQGRGRPLDAREDGRGVLASGRQDRGGHQALR